MSTRPAPCACKPGTYETFWQEVRCPACLESERRSWSRAMEVARNLTARPTTPEEAAR